MLDGDAGQPHSRQLQPSRDPAPLILSLTLAADDQARLDRLRAAHFPSQRNFLAAHVTMFHHLPGDQLETIAADLAAIATATPAFTVRIARLQSLGRGVALALEADPLLRLRAALARKWAARLTAQDSQGYRPHVTIQNKVDPVVAKALLHELSKGFSPWDVSAIGLSLWHYRGGPWEPAGSYAFTADAAAPP